MAPLLVPKAPGTKGKRQEVTMSATKAASESDRAGIGVMPPPGALVELQGLLARPELNGLQGPVKGLHSGTGRSVVVVSGESIRAKPENPRRLT